MPALDESGNGLPAAHPLDCPGLLLQRLIRGLREVYFVVRIHVPVFLRADQRKVRRYEARIKHLFI